MFVVCVACCDFSVNVWAKNSHKGTYILQKSMIDKLSKNCDGHVVLFNPHNAGTNSCAFADRADQDQTAQCSLIFDLHCLLPYYRLWSKQP